MQEFDKIPRLIGLCGKPCSGKSTATQILNEEFGYQLTDDGMPLRQIGMKYLGLTYRQVYTQEGKLQHVMLNNQDWQVRGILGEIGNAFEEKFGGDIIPLMSYNSQNLATRYVMGSVRRDQGLFWKKHGGLIIEIDNPSVPESEFEFDVYNKDAIDVVIHNEPNEENPEMSMKNLREKLITAVREATT